MATFVAGALEQILDRFHTLPPPSDPSFADADAISTPHVGNVGRLQEAGIVSGYADGTFRPAQVVDRAQVASFIARAIEDVTGTPLPRAEGFDDIGPPHAANIEKLATIGVVQGRADGSYAPRASTTRAQMATIVARSLAFLADEGLHVAPSIELRFDGGALGLTDVAVAAQSGFDRATFTLDAGEGTAGWRVRYVDEARQLGSGAPIAVAGDAVLQVLIEGVAIPPDLDEELWDGERVVFEGDAIVEVVDDGSSRGSTSCSSARPGCTTSTSPASVARSACTWTSRPGDLRPVGRRPATLPSATRARHDGLGVRRPVGTPDRGGAVVDRPLDAVAPTSPSDVLVGDPPLLFPLSLDVSPMAAMLNAELADHPVYDGFEVQWFDDEVHGRGGLVFLQRGEGRIVDYYVDPDLRIDRAMYHIGGGTGRWVECEELRDAILEVTDLGVHADVRFTDVDGREVEVRVDDRLAGRRRAGVLLAPVGVGIERPVSLLLVYLHGFDLVRRVSPDPLVRIDGRLVATGRLPGRAVHRRHLIKYAGPLSAASLCSAVDGPLAAVCADGPGDVRFDVTGRAVTGVRVRSGPARAELVLDPPLPSLTDLPVGQLRTGLWHVNVDGVTLTGGTWKALRRPEHVELGLDVTRRWDPPKGLPALYAVVTRVMGDFRRWPTTYRWRAEVTLPDPAAGAPAHLTSRWERTDEDLGGRYRRATRS